MDHAVRRERALAAIDAAGLDALLVTRMTNIRYLTGFSGSTGMLVLGAEPSMVVDFRYRSQVQREVEGVPLRIVDSVFQLWPELERALFVGAHRRIGFDGDHLNATRYLALTAHDGPQWQQAAGLVERLRACKDADEIAALRVAMEITDGAWSDALGVIAPGATELHCSGEIELFQRDRGGEKAASDIIVASGPRTALPHGAPTERRLTAGEPVMADLGTVVDGYLGDLTRTVHLGPAPDDFREIYKVVLEAQQRSLEALAPGRRGCDVDAVARKVIADAGHGERFGHSLGHAIGLDNHEAPLLSPFNETVLEPGMVTTVEPGIYVPGRGGVRIEDTVVVTESGYENLTSSPKELIEL
jgi:Xaa-Pro aminopeptidase